MKERHVLAIPIFFILTSATSVSCMFEFDGVTQNGIKAVPKSAADRARTRKRGVLAKGSRLVITSISH